MLFYLSGIVPWTYFSGVVNKTSRTFVANSALCLPRSTSRGSSCR
jgi:ABC-type polysaccharide/polyol phosphate export permease